MNIAASIALLGVCPFASLATVPEASSETAPDAAGPKGPLKGTLLTPNSKLTVVVLIVPGSGPTDRDGSNSSGVNASPYRLLAGGLAAKGFATSRIDKCGVLVNVMAVDDVSVVTIVGYVDSTRSWVGVLRRHMHTPCVWVLGHSEGGLVALALIQEENVYGVVLIATPGRSMGEVLRGQPNANPENETLLKQAPPIIDALEHRR